MQHMLFKKVDSVFQFENSRLDAGPELSDVAEALLRLGEDGDTPRPGTSYPKNAASSLVPGRLIWGKVEGHDWWPAKVVRRRSVPVEVKGNF